MTFFNRSRIDITLRLLVRFLKFWMFWKALTMYFYVLVLLRDNGRLLGDNARRSEDSAQQLIILGFQNDGVNFLAEGARCQLLVV